MPLYSLSNMTFVFFVIILHNCLYSAPTDYLYTIALLLGGRMWPRSLQNCRWGRAESADAMRRLGVFLRFGGSSRILVGPSPWRLAHPTSHLHPPEHYHGQYSYESTMKTDEKQKTTSAKLVSPASTLGRFSERPGTERLKRG